MFKGRFVFFSILFFWMIQLGLGATSGFAYEEVQVKNGGTIKGKVTLKGEIPSPRIFLLSMSPFGTYCKKIADEKGHVLLKEFNVGSAGGLSDAIIAIQGVEKGKSFPHIKAEILATDCMFHPAGVPADDLYETDHKGVTHHIHPMVSVIENHQPISVTNKDPIFHNGQIFQRERGNIMLNFPLPISGEPQGGILEFDKGLRVALMICGMHEFMQSWGFAVDNPYYAKSNRDGEYIIDQLPPGTYKIHVWYPHFKVVEKEIKVTSNSVIDLNFEFDASVVKRRAFETEKGIRSFE